MSQSQKNFPNKKYMLTVSLNFTIAHANHKVAYTKVEEQSGKAGTASLILVLK